jgi:hypothetical protein
VSYGEEFIGPTIEASYGPLWGVLSGRVDLTQVSFFKSGEAAFRLFPMLGLDLMAEPPTQWRVKPYFWLGARTIAYTESFESSPIKFQHDSDTHWRWGLGGKFSLTNRLDLFAETQLYANDLWFDGPQVFPEGDWSVVSTGSIVGGLVGAEIGARFALGK